MAKYLQFFTERIPGPLPPPRDNGDVMVPCVFHSDKNPSLSVNIETGKWKCYTPSCPGHAGGGYKKFDKLLKGEVVGAAPIETPPIDAAALDGFHHILLQTKSVVDLLMQKRGLTLDTIKRFKLGWDGDRILIPIVGPDGSFVNVRKYKPGAAEDKYVSWAPRYNRARLFPYENIAKSDWLLLLEGETDCMVGCQLGLPAITATNGADSWPEEFCDQLKGKHLVICYDADKAGKTGASRIAVKMLPHAASVKIVRLPLAGSKEEKDFTDYVVKLGHTRKEVDALIAAAEPVKQLVKDLPPAEELTEIHLSRIGERDLVGKRVRATVLVAGKDLAPFQVPSKVAFNCMSVGQERSCDRCKLCTENGQMETTIPSWSVDMLRFVNTPLERLRNMLADAAGVPAMCPRWKSEVTEYANIEAIKCIPEIDFSTDADTSYVIRSLFFLGHGIKANQTYHIEGVVMPEPKTQYATALIYSAAPSQDSIEKFDATPQLLAALKIFQEDA